TAGGSVAVLRTATNPPPTSGAAAGYHDPVASGVVQSSSAVASFGSMWNTTESTPRSAAASSVPSGAKDRSVTSAPAVSTRRVSPSAGSSRTSSPAAM